MEDKKSLTPIKGRVTKMNSTVADLIIKDQATLKVAINILAGIKSVMKSIKEWKDERIKPIKDSIKKLEADVKPFEVSCNDAELEVKNKIASYHREVAERERIEAEKIAKQVESGKIKVETGAKKMDKVEKAETNIKSDKGSVVIKKVKDFEVVDLSKIPLKYHTANLVEIRKAMNEGVELEGVRYFEKEQVAIK